MDRRTFYSDTESKLGKGRFTIWFFPGSTTGISFSFSRLQLLLGFCVLLLTGAFLGHITTQAVIDYSARKERQAFVDGREFGAADVARDVSILRQEIEKVRMFENDVRTRVLELSSVLRDVGKLSFGTSPEAAKQPSSSDGTKGGVGGSEGLTFLNRIKPAKRLSQFSRAKDPGFLPRLDSVITTLRTLPIGIPVQGRISSVFGWRRSPFSNRLHRHDGVDVAADYDSVIVATADGEVVKAEWQGDLGRTVIVDHGNGFSTVYAHLHRITVAKGQRVCRGEQVGLLGTSGRSTGPHLHYEVRDNGRPINPMDYIDLAGFLRFFLS